MTSFMEQQTYDNHRRVVPRYHIFTSAIIIAVFVIAAIGLVHSMMYGNLLYAGIMPFLIAVALLMLFIFARSFALKVQDRTIRAEENLRHYVLTGKLLDQRLTMGQIIALRFAPDEEYIPLMDQAIAQGLKPDEIKKAIKNWKADHHRA